MKKLTQAARYFSQLFSTTDVARGGARATDFDPTGLLVFIYDDTEGNYHDGGFTQRWCAKNKLAYRGEAIYPIPDSDFTPHANSSYEFIPGPLFPDVNSVSPRVITQSGFGDCYLLAALLCIVRRDPSYMLLMIKELPRQRKVVVRFFDKDNYPLYLILDKTKLTPGGSLPSNKYCQHAANWVYIIEKAFAVYRMLSNHNILNNQADLPEEVNLLRGGYAQNIFPLLLGVDESYQTDASYQTIDVTRSTLTSGIDAFDVVYNIIKSYYDAKISSRFNLANYSARAAFMHSSMSFYGTLISFLSRKSINELAALIERLGLVKGSLDPSEFVNASLYSGLLTQTLPDSVVMFILQACTYRGHYGVSSDVVGKLFSAIKGALEQGCMLAAISKDDTVNRGGILYNHVYEIIACHCRGGPRTTITGGQRKYFIVLRNPWHSYGCYYDTSTVSDPTQVEMPRSSNCEQDYSEVRNNYEINYGPIFDSTFDYNQYVGLESRGVFEIEIIDFIKRFSCYTIYKPRLADDYRITRRCFSRPVANYNPLNRQF